jgi:hypothetical protein
MQQRVHAHLSVLSKRCQASSASALWPVGPPGWMPSWKNRSLSCWSGSPLSLLALQKGRQA